MYVTLRRYAEVGARMYEIIARRVEEGLVPTLKAQPGFRCYCAFVSEDGDGVSMTVFDERAQAARANEQVRGWGRANLRDLLPDRPEVFAGECGIAEVSPDRHPGRGQRQPPIVAVREFDDLGPVEETREIVRRHILPIITGSPGFQAVYVFRNEQEQSRGATVTLFDTREDAMRWHERSVQAFRERAGGMAPTPPRVAAGRAIVFATAD
jgi:heme-degrading monooxygenase HmoA